MVRTLVSIFVLWIVAHVSIAETSFTELNDNDKEKSAKTEEKIEKSGHDYVFPEDMKADSLKQQEKKAEVKKVDQPSFSTLSFNIIFQMIYRFSFSEIFDSSMGSPSDMESIRVMD
jgi:hypothetical protein